MPSLYLFTIVEEEKEETNLSYHDTRHEKDLILI
jgi:hypothetical protein